MQGGLRNCGCTSIFDFHLLPVAAWPFTEEGSADSVVSRFSAWLHQRPLADRMIISTQ